MKTRERGKTILLSDSEEAASVAAMLANRSRPVTWYTSLEELIREQPLSSISVLILHFRRPPRGILLTVIARMALEYPGIQKVAVFEGPPSLQHAEYLTACGVDLIWAAPKEEKLHQLATAVNDMQERTPWVATMAG